MFLSSSLTCPARQSGLCGLKRTALKCRDMAAFRNKGWSPCAETGPTNMAVDRTAPIGSSTPTGLGQPPADEDGARCSSSDIELMADRKSTRLNSSHMSISYAVFCLKKKKQQKNLQYMNPQQKISYFLGI